MTVVELANARLRLTGYHVLSHSPGDGLRRYRLVPTRIQDFHGAKGVATVIGARMMDVMVTAFIEGFQMGRSSRDESTTTHHEA